MAAYIARVGRHSVAFGMLWTLLPGVERAGKETRKLAADHQACAFLRLAVEGRQRLLGLLPEDAVQEKGTARHGAASAAALLAIALRSQFENAIFALALPTGKIAFLGFRDGLPLIGFDRVVSADAVDDAIGEYLEVLGERASTVEFYGSGVAYAGQDLRPLELGWFGGVAKKAVSAARVRRAKPRILLWTAVATTAALALVALESFDAGQKQAMARPVRPMQDPAVAYASSAAKYLAQAGYPAMTVAGAVIDTINALPVYHEGWRLDKAACVTGSCVLAWSNGDGGTYAQFAGSPLPGIRAFKTTYKEGLSTIETRFDFALRGERGVDMALLPQPDKFVVSFGSSVQQMKTAGLAVTLGEPVLVGVPPQPPTAAPITAATLAHPVLEGTWKMTGDWLFYAALSGLPPNMTIDTVDVGMSGDSITMNVSGKYYVKN